MILIIGWTGEKRYRKNFTTLQRRMLTAASVQFSSAAQSCPTLCDPMNRSTPGLPVHHQLPEFTETHVHWVGDAIQPSHPLSSPFFLPPIPPSIRVFSNESTLRMRWPKYWSFSFSIVSCKKPKMHCQKFCSSQTCIGKVCSLMLCINRKYIVHA